MFLVSTSSEIKESSGVMAMSPVGWLSICCRRFSDCSSWLVQSWHASSMPSPSPPYSGGKTDGEKKSLRVSWKSPPCRCIYSCGKRSMSLVLDLRNASCNVLFRMWDNKIADPLFDLIRQEGADHGEDRPEKHWLIDQMDSSDFQWKWVLNTQNQW